ncbi:MAG TPA: hypothetical protein VMZ27_15715 [Candidatus Saccharimonadales bacterium]|nr:hypothetical protein [Candidatus Saccharimonadales bacterium]
MNLERSPEGLRATLRISGVSRFLGAGFLSFWLVGWAAGEVFALWILTAGVWSLVTGHPQSGSRQPIAVGMALPMGLFLLFWLTLWSFGGIMAIRELLRLLFGRDSILATPERLELHNSYGLFRTRKTIPRAELRYFYLKPCGKGLCVETINGSVELTRLGNPKELQGLEQTLNQEYRLSPQALAEGVLPVGWVEAVSPEREKVLIKDPSARRRQAVVAWVFCALILLLGLYLGFIAQGLPSIWIPALIVTGIAALIAAGAAWLSFGRHEWRLESGRLILQRRFGLSRTTQFESVALELREDNSGEDGPSYELTAIAPNAPPRPNFGRGKHRRLILSQSNDPTVARNLGLWLSRRCQVPLADRATRQMKTLEIEDLKRQLADSGAFGRTVLRVMERLAP